MTASRAVLLDLDGTIADPREGFVRCVRHALERSGIACPPDSELVRHIGPPLHRTLASLSGHEDPADVVRLFRERYAEIGILENEIYAGVPEVLDTLRHAGFRLFVATSKPTVFAARIVQHFGLQDFFEAVHGSEMDGTRGDKGEVIAAVVATHGLVAANAVMVGDREHDVRGARANRMASIGALWGYGSRAELEAAGADAVCAAPSDLPAMLASGIGRLSHLSPFPA